MTVNTVNTDKTTVFSAGNSRGQITLWSCGPGVQGRTQMLKSLPCVQRSHSPPRTLRLSEVLRPGRGCHQAPRTDRLPCPFGFPVFRVGGPTGRAAAMIGHCCDWRLLWSSAPTSEGLCEAEKGGGASRAPVKQLGVCAVGLQWTLLVPSAVNGARRFGVGNQRGCLHLWVSLPVEGKGSHDPLTLPVGTRTPASAGSAPFCSSDAELRPQSVSLALSGVRY